MLHPEIPEETIKAIHELEEILIVVASTDITQFDEWRAQTEWAATLVEAIEAVHLILVKTPGYTHYKRSQTRRTA